MIYPKKISNRKIDEFIRIFRICIILISLLMLIINKLTTPKLYWSHLCILGFLYIYVTVRYSISRTRNIAFHVAFQTIISSFLMIFIDYRIGYSGWSINISIPIIIILSNITMIILTIVTYKDYSKYAISQLILVIFSFCIFYYIYRENNKFSLLIIISIIISLYNFCASLVLCHRDFKEEIIKKFNL